MHNSKVTIEGKEYALVDIGPGVGIMEYLTQKYICSENTGSYLHTVASDFTKSVVELMLGEDTTDISISANDDPTKAVEEEDDKVDETQTTVM